MEPREWTKKEREAVRDIKKACTKMPNTLMFWANGMTLMIVDAKTKQVFERIYIHSDGGDCGTIEIDGVEFLNLI